MLLQAQIESIGPQIVPDPTDGLEVLQDVFANASSIFLHGSCVVQLHFISAQRF